MSVSVAEGSLPEARLVIVSNRGPKDFVWRDGQWTAEPATGGLVSMLTPLAGRSDVAWFCCVSEPPDSDLAARSLFTTAADQQSDASRVVPIPLPAAMYDAYYGRISNEILWMLQHLVIGGSGIGQIDEARHRAWHEGYLEANRRVAETVARACPAAGAFLIQDYHLYPLPQALRAFFPSTPMLHFTHIPFPEPSVFRLLPAPWRRRILNGLLSADVVGLQTSKDVRAFLACCADLLSGVDVDADEGTVTGEDGRAVRVRTYPASVDPAEISQSMQAPSVERSRRRLVPSRGQRTMIRVDRLDPSKNQLIGFLAFARLLEMRPDLCGDLNFQAFLVPSRTDLSVYRDYRDRVYETIEAINARFSTCCGGPPIEVFYTNDREQALAAMAQCDVLLVNSLQDGMNLVAKEWAIVSERPGVLVLSETAGAREDVGDAALLVSPLDVEGTAAALADALDMAPAERWTRLLSFRRRVERWTSRDWLAAQLADLDWDVPDSVRPLPAGRTGG